MDLSEIFGESPKMNILFSNLILISKCGKEEEQNCLERFHADANILFRVHSLGSHLQVTGDVDVDININGHTHVECGLVRNGDGGIIVSAMSELCTYLNITMYAHARDIGPKT